MIVASLFRSFVLLKHCSQLSVGVFILFCRNMYSEILDAKTKSKRTKKQKKKQMETHFQLFQQYFNYLCSYYFVRKNTYIQHTSVPTSPIQSLVDHVHLSKAALTGVNLQHFHLKSLYMIILVTSYLLSLTIIHLCSFFFLLLQYQNSSKKKLAHMYLFCRKIAS